MSNVQINLTPVGDPELYDALYDAQLVADRTQTPCSYRHTNGRVYSLKPKQEETFPMRVDDSMEELHKRERRLADTQVNGTE